jgi:hypothetical protein
MILHISSIVIICSWRCCTTRTIVLCDAGKRKGKDPKLEVLTHLANGEVFLEGGHIFDQLGTLIRCGLQVGDSILHFKLFKCHDLVAHHLGTS